MDEQDRRRAEEKEQRNEATQDPPASASETPKEPSGRVSRLRRRHDPSRDENTSPSNTPGASRDIPPNSNPTSERDIATGAPPPLAANAAQPHPEQRTVFRSLADGLSSLRLGFVSPLQSPLIPTTTDTQSLSSLRRSGGKLLESTVPHVCICGLTSLGGVLGRAVRPFVRMHVVDARSGAYWRGCDAIGAGPVAPQVTRQAQLKGSPSDLPVWNQDVLLLQPDSATRLRYMDLMSEHCLMLFEVLDEAPLLSNYHSDDGVVERYTRLGWAFLRPIGLLGHVNIGSPALLLQLVQQNSAGDASSLLSAADAVSRCDAALRLQIYEYQSETTVTSLQRLAFGWPSSPAKLPQRYPDSVPEVYMQWRRQQHVKVECLMLLSSGMRVVPDVVIRAGEAGTAGGAGTTDVGDGPKLSSAKEDALRAKLRNAVLKRTKASQEACVPPNRREGAMVVSFSSKGHLLAVGGYVGEADVIRVPGHTLPFSGSLFGVAVFDPDTGVLVWADDRAHFGMVYDVRWSLEDNYLLTCSSDGTCKVWNMKPLLGVYNILHTTEVAEQAAKVCAIACLSHQPAVYVYAAIFQEYGSGVAGGDCPRIFTGAEDGKIRVWQESKLLGELSVPNPANDAAITPHQGKVHALVIDVRSRYLLSGDSLGCILIWRTDAAGWYQLLRKFRKDDVPGTSISSLSIHPDRAKGRLLVLEQPYPGIVNDKSSNSSAISAPIVRLYDLSSYRVITNFPGVELPSVFCRASISSDGRYILIPTSSKNRSGGTSYSFQIRDASNGNTVSCDACAASMLHPVRSIAWHPRQHMVAVAAVGSGSAVMIFCANKDNVQAAVRRMGRSGELAGVDAATESDAASHNGEAALQSTHPSSAKAVAQESAEKESVKELRAAKTREILEKIRNAKAQTVK